MGTVTMNETGKYVVEVEKNMKSACILDTETLQVYMLVKFTILDLKKHRYAFIEELHRICRLLNQNILFEQKCYSLNKHNQELINKNALLLQEINEYSEENRILKEENKQLQEWNKCLAEKRRNLISRS